MAPKRNKVAQAWMDHGTDNTYDQKMDGGMGHLDPSAIMTEVTQNPAGMQHGSPSSVPGGGARQENAPYGMPNRAGMTGQEQAPMVRRMTAGPTGREQVKPGQPQMRFRRGKAQD